MVIKTTKDFSGANQLSIGGFSTGALVQNFKDHGFGGLFKAADIGILEEYNRNLEEFKMNGTQALAAVEQAHGKLTGATRAYIVEAGNSRVKTEQLSGSLAALGVKSAAASIGVAALRAALNVGISLAINAIISAITHLVTAQERAIEKANELQTEWKDAATSLAQTKSTIAEISGEWEQLSQGVDSLGKNVSLTADEYARYNTISNQIAEMFPEMVQGYTAEGDAIIKTKGNVEALTEAYEKMAEAQRGAVISGANDVIKGIQAQTVDNSIGEKSLLNQYKALEEYLNLLAKGEQELANQIFNPNSKLKERRQKASALDEALREIGVRDGNLNENAYANQKELNIYLRGLKTQLESAGMGYYPIIDALLGGDEGYKKLEDETKAMVSSVFHSIDPETLLGFSDLTSLGTYVIGSILRPLENTNLSSSIAEALDLQSAFSDSEIGFGEYKNQIKEVEQLTKDLAPEVRDAILSMFDTSAIDPLINKLKESVLEEDWAKLYNLSLDDLKLATTIELDPQISYAFLNAALEKARAEAIKSSAEISKSFEGTQGSEKALSEARKELEVLGAVSKETFAELVEANEEFKQALDDSTGYLTINYEAAQKIVDKEYEAQKALVAQAKAQNLLDYRGNAKELKELDEELKLVNDDEEKRNEILKKQKSILLKQEGILEEIRNLEILGSSLEYATSAYKKWLDAQDAPENSDIFESLKGAVDQITEGYKSGKTGTQKFKTAAELIFGENWVNMTQEEIQSGLKNVEKYFTEDAEGMLAGVNKLYADGILGKDGDKYFSVAGKTVEDYADSLGLGVEATRYFLAALKDYGWEIDIPGMGEQTVLIQDYENALKAVEEQQAKVDKLTSQYDPKTATLEETKELVEEQQKLLDLQTEAANKESQVSLVKPEDDEIAQLKTQLKELQDAYDKLGELAVKGKVDEKFLSELETAERLIEQINGLSNIKALEDEFKGIAAELKTQMESGLLPESVGVPLLEQTEKTIKDLHGRWVELNKEFKFEVTPSVEADAFDFEETPVIEETIEADTEPAKEEVDKLKEEIEKGTTLPVTIRHSYTGGGTDEGTPNRQDKNFIQKLFGFSKGTRNAPDGPALVGEGYKNGKYQPELVIKKKKGEYFVADRPQLVDLDRGDQVLNGEETKELLKGNKTKAGFAYAGGLGDWWNKLKKGVQSATVGIASIFGSNSTNKDVSASGKFPSSSNKNSSSSGAKKVDPADLVDWIPRLLERLSKYTEKLVSQAEKAIGYLAQNMGLDKALANTKLELEKNEAAYARYMKQAESVGLSQELVRKIQEGEIDIEAYDEATRELITNYQKWYELANGCLDTVEELKEQQIELSKQKLDNINTYYENRLDRLQAQTTAGEEQIDLKAASGKQITAADYNLILSSTQQRIEQLTAQRAALGEEFEKLVGQGIIQKDTDAWHEYTGQIEELGNEITQTQIDLIGFKDAVANLPLTNLDYALEALKETQSAMESMMSLHEAQNAKHEAGDYEALIRNSMEQMNNLEQQNVYLREQQMDLDVLSEKYQELQNQITANEEEILQAKIAQEGWNDAIIDLKISKLEEEREELEKTNDTYQKQLELQEALDNLEKAKTQRTKRIYRGNQGFVYEQDRDALQEAQERMTELRHQETLDKIDEAIDALENQKQDDNVYNYEGHLIKPYSNGGVDARGGLSALHGSPGRVETIFNAEDGKKLFDLIHGTDNLAHEVAKKFNTNALFNQIATAGKPVSNTVSIGDIVIEKADDADSLASDILNNLPSAILRQMYKN